MEDRAKFIGYQECPGHAPLALYNVLDKGHRLYGSTVSAATLAREKIPVPETPKYYDPDQLAMGIKVEMEHTSDPAVAEKIAKDHLDEIPDYYTRLAKMEGEAGVKAQNKNLIETIAKPNTDKIWPFKTLANDIIALKNGGNRYILEVYLRKKDAIILSTALNSILGKGTAKIESWIGRKIRPSDSGSRWTVYVDNVADSFSNNWKNLKQMIDQKTGELKTLKIEHLQKIESETKQNPDTTERDQIIAEYERQGIETLHGKGGFWKRDKASQKSLGFVTLAKARKETGIDLHKTRGPAMVQSSWGDYAIIEMLNRPRKNPANKSYKGDTDVKAIGNIPAPRPGMMMVVNPAKPQRWSMARMEKFLAEKNATDGTNFNLIGAYGQYELWSGGDRIDAGSLQDIYNAWVKVRYNEKYQAKKNPALLVLNPSMRLFDANKNHDFYIGKDDKGKTFYNIVPVGSARPEGGYYSLSYILKVKGYDDSYAKLNFPHYFETGNPSKLQRWHDRLDRHYKTLERLAAHVGIKNADGKKLSVALLKLENQAHKATTDYANGDIDEAQMDKIDYDVTGKVFKLFGKLPGFFINRDPRGYALKIDDKFMPRYENVGLERDMGGYGILSPEISKENPAKLRKLPGQELYRVTGPSGRVHAKGTTKAKAAAQKRIIDQAEKKNPGDLYDELKSAGVQTDHHESDLYFPVNDVTSEIVKKYLHRNIKTFTVQKGHPQAGQLWYEAPFAYTPFWEKKQGITKKNPMVKDMTTYRQKQQIKADVKRMAQMPQRRPHPEFANLKAAAEYVDKALGKVITIIHGKSSYVIRHANGIAAFSKEKNNKLIML